jgi:hypothetical protein
MHDPTRLSAGANDALSHLLRAGAAERPDPESLEKALLAVSALGALGLLSTTAVASTTAITGAGAVNGTLAAASAGGVSVGAASAVATTQVASATTAAGTVLASAVGGAGSATLGAAGVSAAMGKAAATALVITLGKWAGAGALVLGVSSGARHWVEVSPSDVSAAVLTAQTAEVTLVPRGELPSLARGAAGALGTARHATEYTDQQLLPSPSAGGFSGEAPAGASTLAPLPKAGGIAGVGSGVVREAAPRSEHGAMDSRDTSQSPLRAGAERAQTTASQLQPPSVVPSSSLRPGSDSEALAREISFVDRGRASLHARAFDEVLSTLVNYEAVCPRQQLIVEVLVLRMEARVGLKQWPAARSLATRVLQLAGSAPQGVRAREVLAQVSDL